MRWGQRTLQRESMAVSYLSGERVRAESTQRTQDALADSARYSTLAKLIRTSLVRDAQFADETVRYLRFNDRGTAYVPQRSPR